MHPTWYDARLLVDPPPGGAPPAIHVAPTHLVDEARARRTRCPRCGTALRPPATFGLAPVRAA